MSMDVTFRESEPFYGEKTDLSSLFESLDQSQVGEIGQEGESGGSCGGGGAGSVLQQPIEGDIPVIEGDIPVVNDGVPSQAGSVPTQISRLPRWTAEQEEQLKVYSRRRGDGVAHQGEQLDQPQLKVYSRRRGDGVAH